MDYGAPGALIGEKMPRLPDFKEGTFLKAADLVALVECVELLKAEIEEHVSLLRSETAEQVSLLKAEIEELRKNYEDLERYEALPELDFNPKVLLLREAREQAFYPWSVRYRSGQGAYFDVPNNECKVGVVDSSDVAAIDIRGDALVPLRLGRNRVKVDVSFPSQNQYFEIEVKRFSP